MYVASADQTRGKPIESPTDGCTADANTVRRSSRRDRLLLVEPDSSRVTLYCIRKGSAHSVLGCTACVLLLRHSDGHSWRTIETRPTQTLSLKFSPARTSYSPDGRVLLVVASNNTIYIYGLRKNDDGKETWALYFDEGV